MATVGIKGLTRLRAVNNDWLFVARYDYDGNDVYQLMAEDEVHGRVVALLIWVSESLTVSRQRALFCYL